ncbi:UNVERIFIED_ORG: NAD(P)-dependent dehydrogenase (short-subunit alcohol dehydrogenase family) [Rhizobium sp. SORGH_AS260]|jgi:NAD(P)-dependent dehydrogenase (short-subunit alcohol dehydrogenase family)|uniref:SDR family NAD(P)-dependent oxidoreductase n=1 Tax=Agrobacterium TaxID=357 RepID=UPI0005F0181D|nr:MULTISPECIES: SDR family NAD(P)-dependent oxidoreductase [Agrobacterium]MBB2907234.1 NAD(P)-dependent dehydrogenase (short-subunit alcohol dehydrogenase family) [Rhizobium sp. RAS22]MDP9733986.1 NAD(P)-dependent dehydrogenase (short-subunit alcohol dehydrogenase family) [Rhizobium sp. SORGH_AS_0285]MDP9754185.1 NAD(P)-dependent dehydrogenase (short-subunit alcohol dehydrogenase family) [Rhizobium sp. SORGH_AS_0260]MBA8801686.1 NAD(P)-dependent dehydrogenase (short-subunit alcohol dehydrogena
MPEKIWFITGASRGFGRIWTEAALERGDKVAATARNTESLLELASCFGDSVLPLQLDVTDAEGVRQAVADAHRYFGRLDVVLNNAGYALVGAVEEIDEQDLRAELDTNVFGMLRVIQASLPYAPLREQAFAAGAKMEFGDPRSTGAAILKLVDVQTPPLRFFLGTEGLPVARAAYSARLSTWEAWEPESNAAQGNGKQHTIATL